jgi:hypothetical protein
VRWLARRGRAHVHEVEQELERRSALAQPMLFADLGDGCRAEQLALVALRARESCLVDPSGLPRVELNVHRRMRLELAGAAA